MAIQVVWFVVQVEWNTYIGSPGPRGVLNKLVT